jgi:predicted membrane-bound mannosyltransferase
MFLGLMHATKETCIIAFAGMFLALILTLLMQRRLGSIINAVKPSHLVGGLVVCIAVPVLFYSSFLSHPEGILDSIRAYTTYFDRASQSSLHIHPWSYYLKMLAYFRYGDGPFWTEALIILLAVIGFIAAMTKKGVSFANVKLVRFLAFYTLILTVVYSAIPYKTPWCMLGFLHGMILLAGVGAVVLVKLAPNVVPRLIVLALLFEASIHLTWEAYLSNYRYYADSRNPYVYAHPTTEIFTVVQKMEEYASIHKDGYAMPIDIVCPGDDYWPLPWYLRSFRRISWSNHIVRDTDSAPLIIASPEIEGVLTEKLYKLTPVEKRQMYLFLFERPYYVWLRPEVKLLGFVRKDLWDRFQRQPPKEAQVQEGKK